MLSPRPVVHALPTDHETIEALAASILAKAPPRFALAGLSMGGIIAMEMIAQAPDRIERLALLDTNARAEAEEQKQRRLPQIDRVRSGGLERVMRDEIIPNYLACNSDRDDIRELCLKMAITLGEAVFERQSLALRDRPDQQKSLRSYGGPALVLTGADDRLCPLDRHELIHRLMPQSKLVIIDGAGHLPPLERPDETTSAIIRWLEET